MPLTLDNRFEKILLITINHSNAGFFAQMNFVLNQLAYAEKHNYLPVVFLGEDALDGPNPYYDEQYGDNVWNYYFEPVAGNTYEEIRRILFSDEFPLNDSDIVKLTSEQLWYMQAGDPESIYAYPFGYFIDKYNYDPDWYEKQRTKANKIVKKYITLKKNIQREIDDFCDHYLKGHNVLGIHMRGTDKGLAGSHPQINRKVKPKEYYPFIDKYISHNKGCKIFLATDQIQYVDILRKRYGDRVLAYGATRSDGVVNPFQQNDGNNYKKGKDVLIDCLLLSKSDFLLKCASAVGEFATYFNPTIRSIDLNHENKGWNFLNRLAVEYNRAHYSCKIRTKEIEETKDITKWQKKAMHLLNRPAFEMIHAYLDKHTYSRNPIWQGIATVKDYAVSFMNSEKLPRDFVRNRTEHRKKRKGSAFHDPVNRAQKYLEIRTDWQLTAGFFEQFLIVLEQLHYAEAHHLVPVVNVDHKFNFYYDPSHGENVWEYYFEPVSEISSLELDRLDPAMITFLGPVTRSNQYKGNWQESGADNDLDNSIWSRRHKSMMADLVKRYVKIKESISRKADAFFEDKFKASRTLGVQISGSATAINIDGKFNGISRKPTSISSPEEYWPFIDKYIAEYPDCKIFVATDHEPFAEIFKEKYREKVILYDATTRSKKDLSTKAIKTVSGYKKGEDLLIDALLLSKTSYLVRSSSNLAEATMYFNPKLKAIDLSYIQTKEKTDF